MLAGFEANEQSHDLASANDDPHDHPLKSIHAACNSLLLDTASPEIKADAMSAATPQDAAASPLDANKAMFRVKLYELNSTSSWDDKGTGFCEIVFVEVFSQSINLGSFVSSLAMLSVWS